MLKISGKLAGLRRAARSKRMRSVLRTAALVAASGAFLAVAPDALAAAGADDFNTIYERLNAWVSGSLGKSLALAFLVVGLVVGLVRGSLVGALVSIGAGLCLVTMPSILTSLFGAG